jgi:hypothetical protein
MMWNLAKCKMLLQTHSLIKNHFLKFHLFLGDGALGHLDIVAHISSNHTDLVELVHASTSGPSEVKKYMLCDFEKCKMLLKSHSLIKLFLKISFIFW